MSKLVLREYQARGVETFGTLPKPARFFFAWDMGAGKTLGAISVARTYARNKCLIVCPAIVREVWAREVSNHWPERTLGVIRHGTGRKDLSKKKQAELEEALAADVQIVSYDLLEHVLPGGWNMIIVDEFHNLRSVGSKQSNVVRRLFRNNPQAWGLGLSGTPIPNEAQQLWNPVDIFFPGMWGKTSRPNAIPWPFLKAFCNREENEYGTRFYGLREECRSNLAERFAKISMRVVQADFAKYLPSLFVEALPVTTRPDPIKVAKEWLASLGDEVAHVGIYTHLKASAEDICAAVGGHLITGDTPADVRDRILQQCRQSERSIIVGTTHSLKEGVSLSFQKAALIVEWVTEVAQVVQFIGRFARQDSTTQTPTRVQFVVGPNDVSRAETLASRIADIQSVVKSSRADKAAAGVFAAVEMSDEAYQAELESLMAVQQKRSALWSAGEDEDDED